MAWNYFIDNLHKVWIRTLACEAYSIFSFTVLLVFVWNISEEISLKPKFKYYSYILPQPTHEIYQTCIKLHKSENKVGFVFF